MSFRSDSSITTFSNNPKNLTSLSLHKSLMASKRSAIEKNKDDLSSLKWVLSLDSSDKPWQGLPPPAITNTRLSTRLNSLMRSSWTIFLMSVYSEPPGQVRRIHLLQFLSLSTTTWCSHLSPSLSRERSRPPTLKTNQRPGCLTEFLPHPAQRQPKLWALFH